MVEKNFVPLRTKPKIRIPPKKEESNYIIRYYL